MRHSTSRWCVVLLALAVGPMTLTGCSTLFGRQTQRLTVTSNPPGAHVFVADVDSGLTPRTMRIRRDKSPLVLRVQADSSDAVTQTLRRGVSFWGMFFNVGSGVWSYAGTTFGGGPSPVVGGLVTTALFTAIDIASGKLMIFKTDSVHITLPRRADRVP